MQTQPKYDPSLNNISPANTRIQPALQLSVLLAVSIGHMLTDIMINVIPAMLPLMQEAFALSYTQLGVIVMVATVSSSFIQPVFGYITDQRPILWLMSAGLLTVGLGLVMIAFAPSYIWLLIAVAISGIGGAAFHPEAGRTVYLAASENKGFAQSVFQVGGNVGQSLAPLMLPLFLVYTGVQGAWLFILIALLGAWLVFRPIPWLKQRMAVENRATQTVREGENDVSATVLLTVITILRSVIVIGVSSFLPLYYVNELGMDVGLASTYIFIFMLAGSIGTFLGGPAADRWGNKTITVWTLFLSIPFLIWLPFARGAVAIAVIILLGFILVSTTAVSVVYGQKLMPGKVGMVTGLMIGFAYGTAGVFISLLGYLADIWGIRSMFSILTVLLIIGFLLTLFLPKDHVLARARTDQGQAEETDQTSHD